MGRRSRKGLSQGDDGTGLPRSELTWLEESDNPWGVRILDIRPVTQCLLSWSNDPACASNAVSFKQDDGTSFIGQDTQVKRVVAANLQYPIDRFLADGVLFTPEAMEHKWAIFYHQGKIIFVRSWQRKVTALANIEDHKDHVIITSVHGSFVEEDEPPSLTVRVLEYLLISHALKMNYPAPIPLGMENDPQAAAMWCMSRFGSLAHFATPFQFERRAIEVPLRTNSLLHIAVARGDIVAIKHSLASGIPIDLLARDGLAPLHWALDPYIITLLLDQGAQVDVRSVEGATPLMNAVQDANLAQVSLFLDHGANINAQDIRGFTALHRAAEKGMEDIVKLLLDRGASLSPSANGYTPNSLAELHGHARIVDLLKRYANES